jgi:nucleoside-diphosphate-sugar epimerase
LSRSRKEKGRWEAPSYSLPEAAASSVLGWKALVRAGNRVRVFDNNSRGNLGRLAEFAKEIEFIDGDIRDPDALMRAADGIDEMHHLAFVNGTTYFYEVPELVLDVAVRGVTNVIETCRRRNVSTLIVASSETLR